MYKIKEMLYYWQLAHDTTFLPVQNLFLSEHALGKHYHFPFIKEFGVSA